MIDQADAVVIGGGAFGASATYHLAALGQRVAVVDRFDLASQTSPRAAGQTQQIRYDQVTTRMAIRSVEKILSFEAETGQPLTYHQSGAIKLARTPVYAEQVEDEVAKGRSRGDRDRTHRPGRGAPPRSLRQPGAGAEDLVVRYRPVPGTG